MESGYYGTVKYGYAVLDPRPIPAAAEKNQGVFNTPCGQCDHSSGQLDGMDCRFCGGDGVAPIYGIEVTVAALAERCCHNLDPQHGEGGDTSLTAITEALEAELPPANSILATVRADLDAVGAMVVFSLRYEGVEITASMRSRIEEVAKADAFARGSWPGQRPLPTTETPWPASGAVNETRNLAAIGAAVADFKISIEERVATMRTWIESGHALTKYRSQVEDERADMVRALEAGEIEISLAYDERIAVVTSTHRAAMSLGYTQAPVVLAVNPEFRFGGGDPHRKVTIAQHELGYVDIASALAELSELESGWGGSPTIGGSPQGESCRLETCVVLQVLTKHLA